MMDNLLAFVSYKEKLEKNSTSSNGSNTAQNNSTNANSRDNQQDVGSNKQVSRTKEAESAAKPEDYTPVTMEQMDQIVRGFSKKPNAKEILSDLNESMARADCTTPERQAMFLAQTSTETGGFQTLSEYGGESASAEFKYFTAGKAGATSGYIRQSMGNKTIADAIKFTGKGYSQLTGKEEYSKFTAWLKKQASTDGNFKSETESRIEKELTENKNSIISNIDNRMAINQFGIDSLQKGGFEIKRNGKKVEIEGIDTLQNKIDNYQEEINIIQQKGPLSNAEGTKLNDLLNNQRESILQLADLKDEQTQLKEANDKLSEFKKSLSSDQFKVDLANTDFTEEPYTELLGNSHTLASLTTAYDWKSLKLNSFADRKDVYGASHRLNGGDNGLENREKAYELAKEALGVK